MDRIDALRERRDALKRAGEDVRAEIAEFADENSFVELAAFAFSKSDLWNEEAQGEGVVTGFATVGGVPFYLVAQNFAVSYGGLSKASCEKMVKTLRAAEKSGVPVVYLLHSQGVRVGEGVNVLEGIAELLAAANGLKGKVLQFAILDGEVYGSSAALAALADFVFFTERATLALSSPFVLSAKAGKNVPAAEICGYGALSRGNLPAIPVKDLRDAASTVLRIADLVGGAVKEAELNEPCPSLNASQDAKTVLSLLEEGVEIGANACPEVRTVLARLGGIPVAAVAMDRVRLNAGNLAKIANFLQFAAAWKLPALFFVDCRGAEETAQAQNGGLLGGVSAFLAALGAVERKISVVTGSAVGLGYSLFAAKSAGFDFTFALATSHISLFESAAGAQIEFAGRDEAMVAAVYADEHADPFHAAKGGYLDDIIEPQFLKQYLIAALQTVR